MQRIEYWAVAALLVVGTAGAQEMKMGAATTPLTQLIAEAEANNPQIASAEHAWKAATYMRQQVTTLPDPVFTVQPFSVGSPKPFAGFSNSDFAYIGFGASQDLPYPGKLLLKGEAAARDAETQHAQADVVATSIVEQVKLDYLQLAYHHATLAILQKNDDVLLPLIQSGLSRYSVGQGSQVDVVRAQLEHTKLLREMTMHHEQMEQMQADLKQLLHRPQSSPDIVPEPLIATTLRNTVQELQAMAAEHNPVVHVNADVVQQQAAELKSAQRESKPDFNVGYEFQQTGSGYRDYYMLTLNMRLPRHKRVEAEVAQAGEMLSKSQQDLEAQLQQQLAEVQKQFVAAGRTTELLKEYQQGLLPQAEQAFQLEQSAYESGKQEFAPVLATLLDLLTLQHDYHQTLLDHETSLVQLEALTGAAIR
jgi:outer membrane protein TolC